MRNEVLDCIRARRSTRRFQEKQIEPQALDALLEAAIWAPSGGNNQSWLFTAVQNRQALDRINELVREGFQRWVPDDDYPGKHAAKGSPSALEAVTSTSFTGCAATSPCAITSLPLESPKSIRSAPRRRSAILPGNPRLPSARRARSALSAEDEKRGRLGRQGRGGCAILIKII